ncbi:tudor domain-containing protein 5 isoform 2-T4 [Anomaloglossus baeobatrachus]|uniref:tudor domain-containing protein 5 isoform X2 n=1 Tax=Anomaloglossus baeobatrachus TaxID=238106 RepID=UPI003F501631
MDKDRVLQTLKKDVRSLLTASKFGLSIRELEHDYRSMIGSPLPLRSLDYRSTMELLLDMPDVVNMRTNVDGSVVLSAVVNEETKCIADMVSKQKTSSKRKMICKRRITRPVCHMDLVRRGRVAPVLPASVKSDLRDLLSISSLLVSELESSFYKRFGRSFQYTRYGFYSLLEVLRSVSDFVQVQQTRAGSLLMLKTSASVWTPTVTSGTLKYSNVQHSNPGTVFKEANSYKNVQQNAAKTSVVAASPLASEAPQSAGVTTLDMLFMAAEKEYYANKCSAAQSPNAGNTRSEMVCPRVITENSVLEDGTSSSLPSNSAEGTANRQVISPTPQIETDVDKSLNLDTGAIKTDIAESRTDGSLHGLENKFDKDLKLCLSLTKAGFVISSDLRRDIKHVIGKHPEGLPVSHLLSAYKQYTGKDLPYQELGFMSILDLVGSLGDMLYVEDPKGGQDWQLFDIESKSNESGTGGTVEKEIAADDVISTWSVPTQKSERLKLPWDPLDEPLLVSKHKIPPDAVRKQRLHCLSRMKRGFMVGVYVENVASPSNFYIRCSSKDTSQKLEDMMIEMRFCYSNEYVSSRYAVPDEHIVVGEIYALCVDGDVWWYRVIVHAVVGSEEVQVFYPDFGTLATVKRRLLRFLKACYMRLPAQAVPSTLPFLKPVEGQWSIEAITNFQMQCRCGPLVGVVLQYALDQLCIFLCDTSTEKDVYLHQVLIDKELASPAQEPSFYKMCNPFVHYLNQSPDQPQEESPEKEKIERKRAESPQIPHHEPAFETSVREEVEPDMPYLESFPFGEDLWDEKWSFSGRTAFFNDALRGTSQIVGKDQEENLKPEEKNEFEKISPEDPLSQQMEDFYISLIESRHTSPNLQSPPRKCEDFEKTEPPAANLYDHSLPLTSEKEKLENKSPINESSWISQTARASNPLLKFQIPRRSAAAALGPAARLSATPGSLLHWVT